MEEIKTNKANKKEIFGNKLSKLSISFTSTLKFTIAIALFFIAALFINAAGVIVENGALNVSNSLTISANKLFVNSESGNVGIGTTSPASQLEISKNTASPILTLTRNSNAQTNISVDTGGTASFVSNSQLTQFQNLGAATSTFTGDVRMNTGQVFYWNNPTNTIGVNILSGNVNIFNTNYPDSRLSITSSEVGINNNDPNASFHVTGASAFTGGNVGIGTTSPSSKLHIIGNMTYEGANAFDNPALNLKDTDNSNAGFRILYREANGDTYFRNLFDHNDGDMFFQLRTAGTTLTPLFLEANGGKVAVNQTSATETLEVIGTLSVKSGQSGNAQGLFQNVAGNVGIGTTTPTRKLHVIGNANVSGDISYGTLTANSPQTFLQKENGKLIPTKFCTMTTAGNILSFSLDDNGTIVKNGLNSSDCMEKEILDEIIIKTKFDSQSNSTIESNRTYMYIKVFKNERREVIMVKK